jgi:N-sulfoglucosamine sulfohydrolase
MLRLICFAFVAICCSSFEIVSAAEQPNIIWITAEDMSPTLGCYGDDYATTPNIDRLAVQSSRYTHAFATAPVCSPSRACLINGCIATTQGTHPMRSLFPLPEEMSGFPTLLRKQGYYTSNNVKTDYNSAAADAITASSWDDSSETAHWRNRKPGQPFFSIFNLMTSHQSRTMVWPYEQFQREVQSKLREDQIHDPEQAPRLVYYPDTPLVRKTVARYYDCVTVMDIQVGEILSQLEADGLADDTIVFFYSDHGSGMPRHKRALFDSGMHVPLLIRFPKKYQGLAPSPAGAVVDRLVSFDDFAPTVLSLTGIDSLPPYMRGHAFLGPLDVVTRQYVFGHRDRVDEIIDLARSVRSRDFLYIRNFMPHLGYNQQSAWIDQGEVRQDFYALARSGKATPAQAQYLSDTRPREELYDCTSDPLNLHNLAASAQHQSVLGKMRGALRDHLRVSRDLGFVPEVELWRLTKGTTPIEWAATGSPDLGSLRRAAELVGSDDFEAIGRALADRDSSVRYWGAVSCSAAKKLPEPIVQRLHQLLESESAAVRIEVANAIARQTDDPVGLTALIGLLDHDDETVILHAARAIELLGTPSARQPMQRLADRFADQPGDLAWFIRFTTSGYLTRLD